MIRFRTALAVALACSLVGCASDTQLASSPPPDSSVGAGGGPTGFIGPTVGPVRASTTPSKQPVLTGPIVRFNGVQVGGAGDLTREPQVRSTGPTLPTALQVKDLVTGAGAPATPTSSVKVHYVGVRYTDGVQFDASWDGGGPADFALTGVVPGFTQGIGGTSGVEAMKVGGRRIMILPPALGYPDGRGSDIPPNSALVFVVDLIAVT